MQQRPLIFVAFALIALPALAEDDEHLSARDGVEILHAWTNATQGDTARVYMEITNGGELPVTLGNVMTGAATGWALKGAPIQAGGGALVDVPELTLTPDSDLDLAPDGLFIYLTGLTGVLPHGEDFEMTLTFDPVGEIEVHVAIEDEDAQQHSHAGHSH